VRARVAAFRKELQNLGWQKGHNTRTDIRWATTSDVASMQKFAKELVTLQPNVILSDNPPTTAALLQYTRTIPIVFAVVSDPIGSGFVASFPRPGGNVTRFTNIEPTMASKWLQLLKEIAPRATRVAVLFNPVTAPYAEPYLILSNARLPPSRWTRSPPLFASHKGRVKIGAGRGNRTPTPLRAPDFESGASA
jgi:ABC-type uncharacterized transport system substrate-binding protein